MLRRTIVLTVGFILAGTLTPRTTEAQSGCGPLEICAEGYDRVPCPGGAQAVQNCHSSCEYCWSGSCHPSCNVSALPGQQGEQERKLYARMLVLADELKTEELIRASAGLAGRLYFNPARDAVQLVGCDGYSIVASIPINGRRERMLASSSLPATTTLRWGGAPIRLVALAQVFGPSSLAER